MKKILFTAMFICATIAGYTQEYEPTEGWPYLFKDFKEAIVYFNDGKAESASVNVHLAYNQLQFTDQDNIMVVRDANKIDSVVCEDKTVLIN